MDHILTSYKFYVEWLIQKPFKKCQQESLQGGDYPFESGHFWIPNRVEAYKSNYKKWGSIVLTGPAAEISKRDGFLDIFGKGGP